MAITFHPGKNARDIAERGLSFERVAELDWDTAVVRQDSRAAITASRACSSWHSSMAACMRRL